MKMKCIESITRRFIPVNGETIRTYAKKYGVKYTRVQNTMFNLRLENKIKPLEEYDDVYDQDEMHAILTKIFKERGDHRLSKDKGGKRLLEFHVKIMEV
jgi:hypothetical protein